MGTRACATCAQRFQPSGRDLTCGPVCSRALRVQRQRARRDSTPENRTCRVCGNTFAASGRYSRALGCSDACRAEHRKCARADRYENPRSLQCKDCGGGFARAGSRGCWPIRCDLCARTHRKALIRGRYSPEKARLYWRQRDGFKELQQAANRRVRDRLTDAVVADVLRLPVTLARPLIPAKRVQLQIHRELKKRNSK